MPRKRDTVLPPVTILFPTGQWKVVVDYLDTMNQARVEVFLVKDASAGYARQRHIMREGLTVTENGLECMYPPHRILKISLGEVKIGAQG